jgi:hypothetical protein
MITSTLDLALAVAAALLLPLIIWVNLYNRHSGLMGYLWREAPNLARVGLAFLALAWLGAIQSLATHYGLLAPATDNTLSIALGIPMFLLSLVILVWGGIVLTRFLKGRRGG